jgi:hypothetical protein
MLLGFSMPKEKKIIPVFYIFLLFRKIVKEKIP